MEIIPHVPVAPRRFRVPRKAVGLLLLAFLAYSWWDFTHYSDGGYRCDIKIDTGMEFNNSTIKEGLRILRHAEPAEYREVCAHVEIIETGIGCGGFAGGCYYHGDKTKITISMPRGAVLEAAGVIVHELCHLKQEKEGRPFSEVECYAKDNEIFRALVKFPSS